MTVKNIRHGRIRLQSGDTPALEKVTDFTNGDLTWSENFPTNIIRSRGRIRGVNAGDEQPVDWSFSAAFVDELLYRTLRDKVWDGFAETIVGLTPSANNLNTALGYAYEQGSFQLAAAETGQKLGVGIVPAVDNDFSEELGSADVEGVIRVEKGTGAPGSGGFNVAQPAADVDRDVVYDAVGDTTLVTPGQPADCSGGRKTFKLIFDAYDVCDPPTIDPLTGIPDPTSGTIETSYVLDHAFLVTPSFAEGDEADNFTFAGQALPLNGKVRIVPGGEP